MELLHQTLLYLQSAERTLVVMENYYTHHLLAKQLKILTDDEINVLLTDRINNLDAIHRTNVKKALTELQNVERGSWCLCHVYDKNGENKTITTNCGYIAFKDRKVVLFYTNYLTDTLHISLEG